MHASRVLAIVEDIVDNTGNPDKIRKLMQDLGRNHYKQVYTFTIFYGRLEIFIVLY